jgi:transposase, IS30 family
MNTQKKSYRHLSFEERFVVEKLLKAQVCLREIARFLSRSPNTISREVRRNTVCDAYIAGKAQRKAYHTRWRAKRYSLKVVMNDFLHRFADRKLRERWSPEQISGYLKEEIGIACSAKAIYTFAKQRCYDRYLFWGWNKRKSGPRYHHAHALHDARVYIDDRPELSGLGHYEMDFVVSKTSTWVLLVVIDRLSKKTAVERLPNRKRATILGALSRMFRGIDVKSITTDNDIAFACWREIETLLGTRVYFTHPYHSWEKGLVENVNRWIRCFVPKRRDIGSVTEKELWEIHSFLNDRPRQCLGFKIPSVYHYQLMTSGN